jgi:hypothetical protein
LASRQISSEQVVLFIGPTKRLAQISVFFFSKHFSQILRSLTAFGRTPKSTGETPVPPIPKLKLAAIH